MNRDPRTVLRDAGLRPKKSFGQNFLVAERVVRGIAEACVPESEIGRARVLELGAGLGALTSVLLERAAHVTAVERDRDLVPILARALDE
ncbi:MAG TPA: rRNA adenine N-6-methyltransferase family protein, partial [Polyangiaceae bacterium]|nr:rRNA adenine N-6-methyltransferase family protein [Polyangiaceae bacterium]